MTKYAVTIVIITDKDPWEDETFMNILNDVSCFYEYSCTSKEIEVPSESIPLEEE